MITNKFIILFILNIISATAMADFAIINDPDGYTNVRVNSKNNATIAFKINSGEVFYCLNDLNNGFYQIETNKYNFDNSTLFVHKSRVKFLSSFTALPILEKRDKKYNDVYPKSLDEQSLRLAGSNYTIDLKVKPFNTKSHKLVYDKDSLLKSLDGFSKFWGSDNATPYSEYSLFSIKFNNKVINIPNNQIGDLFNPNLSDTQAFFDKQSQTLYLVAQNGDGAGVYHVVFIFKAEKYENRLVVLDENT